MAHQILKKLETSFRTLLTLEFDRISRGKKRLLYAPRVLSYAGLQFIGDSVNTMAAALAYTTVLSVVPVGALIVLYTKIAGKLDSYNVNMQDWIVRSFVAEAAHGITDYLNEFMNNINTKTLGTIGVAGLLFTAYMLLRSIEQSLNRIWRVKRPRSLWSRFQMLCTLLIFVPTFLTASIYISGKFQMSSTVGSLTLLIPFALTFVSLLVIFKVVPHTYVAWKSAALAAAFSAVLFEAAKIGFNMYVLKIIGASKIYGSLGLLPVFLIWIYYSWTVVLFGAVVAYTIQNLRSLEQEKIKRMHGRILEGIHEEWGWKIVESMIDLFETGKGSVKMQDIYPAIPIHRDYVNNHVEILVNQGLLLETHEPRQGEARFLFSKPTDKIHKKEVINLFRSHLNLTPA